MENVESQPQVGSYVTFLLISGAGLICCSLAMAAYHFILLRCCLGTQQSQSQHTANITPQAIPCGVDPEILNKIPILPFFANNGAGFRKDQRECAICLAQLEEGEPVRLLPSCWHAFHVPCVDAWFAQHSNCPLCRSSITITSPPSLPIPSERVSRDFSSATSTSHAPPCLLRHSLSLADHAHHKPQALVLGLNRSFSMNQSSHIRISIQREELLLPPLQKGL